MHGGEILQVAPPGEIYARPANLFVAEFVGEMNFVKAKIAAGCVECALGALSLPVPPAFSSAGAVTLAIRPEHVELAAADGGPLVGTIASKNYLGDAALVEVDVNGVTLLAKLPGDTDIAVGQKAAVVLRPERWRVFPE